jgi:hypothetical protein
MIISFPQIENEIIGIKLFFNCIEKKYDQIDFECLRIFFKMNEIEFLKKILNEISILSDYNSINDSAYQLILKLSLKIIKFSSNESYNDNQSEFEDFLNSSELKEKKKNDQDSRKKASKKYFKIFNDDKIDQIDQKIDQKMFLMPSVFLMYIRQFSILYLFFKW